MRLDGLFSLIPTDLQDGMRGSHRSGISATLRCRGQSPSHGRYRRATILRCKLRPYILIFGIHSPPPGVDKALLGCLSQVHCIGRPGYHNDTTAEFWVYIGEQRGQDYSQLQRDHALHGFAYLPSDEKNKLWGHVHLAELPRKHVPSFLEDRAYRSNHDRLFQQIFVCLRPV